MVLPIIKRVQRRFPRPHNKLYQVITWMLIVFMCINAFVTVLALHREGQRSEGIPAASPIDHALDEVFPDEWLQERFHNMTVSPDVGVGK